MTPLRQLLICLGFAWLASISVAQSPTSTRPVEGLRTAQPTCVLLQGGEVVSHPGAPPVRNDVLIRGTMIADVGMELDVPTGTQPIDVSGKTLYAGLIDAMHDVQVPLDAAQSTDYWNSNITPQLRAATSINSSDADAKKLREQGIVAQLMAPKDGIVKGTSCLVLMVDAEDPQRLFRSDVFQHATLTVPRGKSRDRYPSSPMGATALLRQSLYDAIWYREANRVSTANPGLSRPQRNVALDALQQTFQSQTLVIDAANERMILRALDVADEFSLPVLLRGSGREYREIDAIARPGLMVLLPVDFPEPPSAATESSVRSTELVDWMHWHFAPENPSRLNTAGVDFCLTTDGLDDPGKFLEKIRVAIERGLDPIVAHASVTTTPAQWMKVDDKLGRIESGMWANLVVTDGDLFGEKTKVLETWVAGQRFVIEENGKDDRLLGRWAVALKSANASVPATLAIEKNDKGWAAKIEREKSAYEDSPESKEDTAGKETKSIEVKLKDVIRDRVRLHATLNLASLGKEFDEGVWRLEILTVNHIGDTEPTSDSFATLTSPSGTQQQLKLKRLENEVDDKGEDDDASKSTTVQGEESLADDTDIDTIELNHPLGAQGFVNPPTVHSAILFRGATLWTCGPSGKLDRADIIVRDGKITEIGVDLAVPKPCHVVDASGKHITPGLIDCHSHIATDGGINETGQAVTAEVRIGDFIDNSDIAIYRQLAGGVTTANIMHGSANPIGGQSQTIKFRWGASMNDMKFAGAAPGIKFALGENVKRSSDRYPTTRMGVEQLLRDQFLAARQYEADRKAWQAGQRSSLPPRRDLQMDALAEVQHGDRWIHCHSYRQDEIVATLDVLEEFNIRIGTLQHILEGYKVADRIAAHGAMASSFADWWAYKFEVFDAIPYNGVLMHDAGVVVSYNSDDPELGRHLNTEAAKATKYGGVPEEEALKFVTLNPAKQLRIDDRVGSIEVGKDADLVIWSGRPLSTTTRCEQTWIDGRIYFSIADDAKRRQRDQKIRNQLIQLAIGKKKDTQPDTKAKPLPDDAANETPEEVAEEDRWLRFDEFCNTNQRTGASQ
ncbi:hypothetical protein Poly51_11150 [Rubripirellula tenax]|uniref:Amidohydrolase-related domain-containing protein n=1 Tax=Rubripirellula tenax TaxID=2528015 RepID=A0A5C6FLX9_9BACT|nr:amidohydrolase family protein [Rubripirellula tenax]TWU60834.1 hypothetical protein Poly51_11150 [Rubripirellula tenax]